MAERIVFSPSRGTLTMVTVRVTPRRALPPVSTITASSPLDALVRWTDRHHWYTDGAPSFTLPPTPEQATVFSPDDATERAVVQIAPLDVKRELIAARARGWKYEGAYTVRVQP